MVRILLSRSVVACAYLVFLSLTAAQSRGDDAAPTFSEKGPPFLQKYCVSCHGEKVHKSDVQLHNLKDNAELLKNRKLFHAVLDQLEAGSMPPRNKPQPGPGEIDAFRKLVTAVYDQHDRNAKTDPGRVTIRRLNKVEYNNTIRDLVGIDFNPADDFPSDDVGYGFDNIGDVLSLSPVLMERYLTAAESITERAILVSPPQSKSDIQRRNTPNRREGISPRKNATASSPTNPMPLQSNPGRFTRATKYRSKESIAFESGST